MSFFLLGKGPDEELHLLSSKPAATRKEALAELSRLTSEAGFAHWDAEVFVLDLEAGTPVLLVRPEGGPTAERSEEPAAVEEPPAAAEEPAEEPAAEEPAAAAGEPLAATELSGEPDHDVDPELAAVLDDLSAEEEPEDVVVVEAPEPVLVEPAEVEPLETGAFESAEEHEPIDAAYAEAVIEEAAEGEEESLKAALARTAAHMEASGITAPESVGPAEPSAEEPPAEEPPAEEPPAEEPPAETPLVEEPPAGPEGAEALPAWPWATGGAESEAPAFTISALEEPGIDEGSLVRAPGDDDTMSASRPVILGAYEGGPSMSEEPDAATAVPDEPPVDVLPVSDDEVAATDASPSVEAASTIDSGLSADTSDFILDLEPLGGSQSGPAGYQASDAPREMTCNDCVYVETCPNKDQRDPTTCGSFQWK